MSAKVFFAGAGVATAICASIFFLPAAMEDKKRPVPDAQEGSIKALIERLVPLAKCSRYYYDCGEYDVAVTVSPRGVRLHFRMENREYDLSAPTLEGAVTGLTNAPQPLVQALEGWKR